MIHEFTPLKYFDILFTILSLTLYYLFLYNIIKIQPQRGVNFTAE